MLAYLFFLKDMDRFMPIQPTGFDRAFAALGIKFTTLRRCEWDNYVAYNSLLDAMRPLIAQSANLKKVRLVDAHSFCWALASLIKREAKGTLQKQPGAKDGGRIYGWREKSIYVMCQSVEQTVRNSNGQSVNRTMKNKETQMTTMEIETHIKRLLDRQNDRCALTGIAFHFGGPDADQDLLPSVDRIDSNGHYEPGNLQIVCRFVNFWKSDRDNEDFRRLLSLVREGASEA